MKRYIEKRGVECTVLTSSSKISAEMHEDRVIRITDPFKRENASPQVHSLRRFNILPDTMIFWSISAAIYIQNHSKEFDRILLTAPPYTLPLALAFSGSGRLLKKCSLDIRDIWTSGTLRQYAFRFMRLIDSLLESFVFSRFSKFSAVTERNADVISKRHHVKVETVYNTEKAGRTKSIENMIHPCAVYAGKIDSVRFNSALFGAFNIAGRKYSIHTYIAGEDENGLAGSYSSQYVHILGAVSNEIAAGLLKDSDAGIIMHSYSMKDYRNVFTYKISEFIGLKKPVFYVGPETEVSEFVRKNGIGIAVNNEADPEKIADLLQMHIKTEYKFQQRIFEMFSEENLLKLFNPAPARKI